MKKITFIVPSLQQGGLENHVALLANSIVKKNYDVSIICYYSCEVFYELNKGIAIYVPPFKRNSFSTLVYYWKSLFFIMNMIKDINPDQIVGFGDNINFISIIACKLTNRPIYIGDMSSPGREFPTTINLFRKFTYPYASGIIAQTSRAKEQKIKMVSRNVPIRIIPNPLGVIENFEIERKNIVLGVARHYYVKGVDRLLDAFSKIKDKSWSLEIAGSEGPETDKLIIQAKALGIYDRVSFLGARKDMDKIYSYASIFVLPSRSEGLPNALIEAMAHGLPCISFDINAGPSDVIEHEVNGILVEDGDIDELTFRIQELIDNKEKRDALGRKATEIKEKLSIDTITNDLLNFIGAKK